MKTLPSRLSGPLYLEPDVYGDERGSFHESFRASTFRSLGISHDFVQDNQSRSSRGVLRGMHFQVGRGQAKLVRCARGEILDVVVDVRSDSPTFGEWESFPLDDILFRQVYVPVGFAHGFQVVSGTADVVYRCSEYYAPEREMSVRWDDPDVNITWPLANPVLSPRDADAPLLRHFRDHIYFGT